MRKYIDLINEASFEDIDYDEVNRLASQLAELFKGILLDYDDFHPVAESIVSQHLVNKEYGQIMTPNLVLNHLYDLHPMDNSNIDTGLLNAVAEKIAQQYSQ